MRRLPKLLAILLMGGYCLSSLIALFWVTYHLL